MTLTRFFLGAIVLTIGFAMAVPVAAFFLRPGGRPAFDIAFYALAESLILAGFLLAGLACAIVRERGRFPGMMLSAIVAGAIAFVGWSTVLFLGDLLPEMEFAARVLPWPTGWVIFVTVFGQLMLIRPRAGWWSALRRATNVCIAFAVVSMCIAISFATDYSETARLVYRIAYLLLLIALASLTVTLISAFFQKSAGGNEADAALPYRLRCPRCGGEQEAMTGEHHHCTQCGLRVRVEVM